MNPTHFDTWLQHNSADDAPEPVWSGATFETSFTTPRYFADDIEVTFTIDNYGDSYDVEPIVTVERATMNGHDIMNFVAFEMLCDHVAAIVSLDQDTYLCSASD